VEILLRNGANINEKNVRLLIKRERESGERYWFLVRRERGKENKREKFNLETPSISFLYSIC
jgi:hypothetical protein